MKLRFDVIGDHKAKVGDVYKYETGYYLIVFNSRDSNYIAINLKTMNCGYKAGQISQLRVVTEGNYVDKLEFE